MGGIEDIGRKEMGNGWKERDKRREGNNRTEERDREREEMKDR